MVRMAGEVLPPGDIESLPAGLKDELSAWIASYEVFIAPVVSPWCGAAGKGSDPLPMARIPLISPVYSLWPGDLIMRSCYLPCSIPAGPKANRSRGPRGHGWFPPARPGIGSWLPARRNPPGVRYPKVSPSKASCGGAREALCRLFRHGGEEHEHLRELAFSPCGPMGGRRGIREGAGRQTWAAKRLQTGLASWATLRHASVLVNDRTAAECGEAGFEPIIMTPPRGYVEPDPKSFEAIARVLNVMRENFESRGVVQSAAGCSLITANGRRSKRA